MPEKYKRLPLHNSVCNEVFYKLQDCEREHPLSKFIGECTSQLKDLEQCIKDNRQEMRKKNLQLSQARQQRMRNESSNE